jgi:hypothetical protein
MQEIDRLIFTKDSDIRRYAQTRSVVLYAVKRIDEVCTSSYCFQPCHIRKKEKVRKISPPTTAAQAEERGVQFHPGVMTPNCHRLKQCTDTECSKRVVHRDGSAAQAICVKLFLRVFSGGTPEQRGLVSNLVESATATPAFLERNADVKGEPPRKKKQKKKKRKKDALPDNGSA